MQEDSTILENKEPKDDNAIDIKSLLETANSSRFDDEETLLREKETFEKAAGGAHNLDIILNILGHNPQISWERNF